MQNLKVVRRRHQSQIEMLNHGLAYLQKLEKFRFSRRKRLASKHFQEVAKVVATVKSDPLHLMHSHAGI